MIFLMYLKKQGGQHHIKKNDFKNLSNFNFSFIKANFDCLYFMFKTSKIDLIIIVVIIIASFSYFQQKNFVKDFNFMIN